MKTLSNVTRFACDHCGKEYKVARYVPKHEESCKKNPENAIACAGCVFLEKVDKSAYIDTYDGREFKIDLQGFRCTKRGIGLFPPKVLHSGIVGRYPETFYEEELMPIECDLHSFDEIFDPKR